MKMVIIGVTMIGLGALIILMGLRSDSHRHTECIGHDEYVKRIEDWKKISDEKSEIINEQSSLINELLSKEREELFNSISK